jgi:mono/diheme cytochrome c family protein
MSKSFLLLPAVLLLAITSTPSSGRMSQEAAPAPAAAAVKNPVKPTADSQAKAKKLYSLDCSMCHNDNGNGKSDLAKDMQLKLSDWTDPKSLAAKSDKELFDLIRSGKDKMPAEAEGRAKDDEIWNLVIYIRSLSKNQPAAEAAPAAAPTN